MDWKMLKALARAMARDGANKETTTIIKSSSDKLSPEGRSVFKKAKAEGETDMEVARQGSKDIDGTEEFSDELFDKITEGKTDKAQSESISKELEGKANMLASDKIRANADKIPLGDSADELMAGMNLEDEEGEILKGLVDALKKHGAERDANDIIDDFVDTFRRENQN